LSPDTCPPQVFVSLSDCNFDYSSPSYFNTKSRTIVRMGDFRISSNYTKPAGLVQAFSISLGDVTVHLGNHRYPYQAENSKLCRASKVMGQHQLVTSHTESLASLSIPETLLREMSFINVLALDSMDAILAIASASNKNTGNSVHEPHVTASLTFGLLSVHACKDSFDCFTSTIGELQAKLTSLSDEDIVALKEESKRAGPKSARQSSSTKVHPSFGVKDTQQAHISSDFADQEELDLLGPTINELLVPTNTDTATPFLLDGYDWTTIDHDVLREVEIPSGDEQVAVWYSRESQDDSPATQPTGSIASRGHTGTARTGVLPTIIHQHFPIHPATDPLSEGDMDATKFAGTASPGVKSRILIHDLTVKVRFFDGYDWPELLSPEKRNAGRRASNFVIEPIPKETMREDKAKLTEKVAEQSNLPKSALERRAKLMGSLLDKPDTNPPTSTFSNLPLPEERGARIGLQEDLRRLSRKTHRFFQVSANGVSLRADSFEESKDHKLVSIIDLSLNDLFLAETISHTNPVKMFGEWVNETQHPRDSKHGSLMLKVRDV
jgi:hypothetical protein